MYEVYLEAVIKDDTFKLWCKIHMLLRFSGKIKFCSYQLIHFLLVPNLVYKWSAISQVGMSSNSTNTTTSWNSTNAVKWSVQSLPMHTKDRGCGPWKKNQKIKNMFCPPIGIPNYSCFFNLEGRFSNFWHWSTFIDKMN